MAPSSCAIMAGWQRCSSKLNPAPGNDGARFQSFPLPWHSVPLLPLAGGPPTPLHGQRCGPSIMVFGQGSCASSVMVVLGRRAFQIFAGGEELHLFAVATLVIADHVSPARRSCFSPHLTMRQSLLAKSTAIGFVRGNLGWREGQKELNEW